MVKEKKKTNKKKIIKILIIILVLCLPIPGVSREGEVASYKAVLFSFTRYRVLGRDNYYTISKFHFFPMNWLQ